MKTYNALSPRLINLPVIKKIAMKNDLLDLENAIKAHICCSVTTTQENIARSENAIRREIAASKESTQEDIVSLRNQLKILQLQNNRTRWEHEIELEYKGQEWIKIMRSVMESAWHMRQQPA